MHHRIPLAVGAVIISVVTASCSSVSAQVPSSPSVTESPTSVAAGVTAQAASNVSVEVATATTSDESSSATSVPVGLVALGNSGITGEGGDGVAGDGIAEPENSWATGTVAGLGSIYQRMTEEWPETEGHVRNAGIGGTGVESLKIEADAALVDVPNPRIILIGGVMDDILCEGDNDAHVPEFANVVDDSLTYITSKAPNSTILFTSDPSYKLLIREWRQQVLDNPSMFAYNDGPGICHFFDEKGTWFPENVKAFLTAAKKYQSALVAVCKEHPQCNTDHDAQRNNVLPPSSLADGHHANLAGQAQIAKVAWPVVEDLLSKD